MTAYMDEVFAPIDQDHTLERIAGGNETEVYRTDDQRFVVKIKHDLGSDLRSTLITAQLMRAAARTFAACLGEEHSIPSEYVIARDSEGRTQVMVIQPCLANARPLAEVDYAALSPAQRDRLGDQLRAIVRRSLTFYRATRNMPDLYGRASSSAAERARLKRRRMIPWRLWSFIVKRNLLRSRNLMLCEPDQRIVLVDYDYVRRSRLYRLIYFTVRWVLFWRDQALITTMKHGWPVPRGH
ncbi:MAG TPA: hypothetical protein VGE07_23905 [Herpetosiphonaceae bacterium]